MWWLKIKIRRGVDKNKCGGGIDLFITYVCLEKKNCCEKKKEEKEKERDVYGKKEKNCEKQNGLMSPFPMI